MSISLTPHPDHETEDLATVLTPKFTRKACAAHGLSVAEFYNDRGSRDNVTLRELRDWLGY